MRPPRLGWLSGAALLTLLIAQIVAIPVADPTLRKLPTHLWLAAVWGGWSIAVWFTLHPPLNLGRMVAAILLLGWHCAIMHIVRDEPFVRYVIMFAGFAVLQISAAWLLRLPRWKILGTPDGSAEAAPSAEPRPGQFRIFCILGLMGIVAILMWAIRGYGDAGGDHFIRGGAVVLLGLAAISATAIAAATLRRWGLLLLPLIILVAAAAASSTAWQEIVVAGGGDFASFRKTYFTIEATFGLIVYAIGLAGRR